MLVFLLVNIVFTVKYVVCLSFKPFNSIRICRYCASDIFTLHQFQTLFNMGLIYIGVELINVVL